MDVNTDTGTAGQSTSTPRSAPISWPGIDGTTIPPAGRSGHGVWACLRRQPVRMVGDRAKGGYTAVFEIICRDCGDHSDMDYTEVIPRLQRLRGPYSLNEGLAAYERHLGLTGRAH